MRFEITQNTYQGPLDKLLTLVEEKKLEISAISLAEVTADFIKYVQGLAEEIENATEKNKDLDPSLLADFLSIASKLILIKSKNLLPSLVLEKDEESDIQNLEARLRLYQEFKKAREYLRRDWSEFPQMVQREFLSGMGPIFYPPPTLTEKDIAKSLNELIGILEKTIKPVGKIKSEIINLKSKIEEIIKRLGEEPKKLGHFKQSGSKNELIVLFLAVLHLIKDQLIHAEQTGDFEEITIAKKGGVI